MNLIIAGINPLNITQGLIFWTLVTFILVVIVLKITAWGPIIKALDARENKINDDIKSAKDNREEAETLTEQKKKELDKQLSMAQEIISEEKRDAEALKKEIIENAEKEASKIKERALKDIELAKVKALSEVQSVIVGLSITIAGQVLGEKIDANAHKSFIEASIKQYSSLN